MKTTLELPDALFREVKSVAARRGTTLKALITEGIREKLHPKATVSTADKSFRLPVLPQGDGAPVTKELVERIDSETAV